MLTASAKTLAKLLYTHKTELKFVVGSGLPEWDNFNPPPFADRSTLFNENYRANVISVDYVDPQTYAVSGTPTNALKIVGQIPSTSSIDGQYIREKAIFWNGASKDLGDLLHAETTALETKVVGKQHESIIYIILR